jgi:hypothetical protein
MDTAFKIPGIRVKVGLDPIIGLIPGLGDIVATLISAYIIFLAARFRLPTNLLMRMVFNVGLETVVGSIPLLGDVFDAFYKSNIRNLALLETHLSGQAPDLYEVDNLNLHSVTSSDFA